MFGIMDKSDIKCIAQQIQHGNRKVLSLKLQHFLLLPNKVMLLDCNILFS